MIIPLYGKLIAGGVAAAALGVGVASWLARGAEIERLSEWQSSVTLAVAQADGSGLALKPSEVPAAISALKSSRDNAEAELLAISNAAKKDDELRVKLDEQLAAILKNQDASAAGTRARISDLMKRQPTGDPAVDCAVMESDSNAAWDGWRK